VTPLRPVLPSGKAYERLLTSIEGTSSLSLALLLAMLVGKLIAFVRKVTLRRLKSKVLRPALILASGIGLGPHDRCQS